MERAEDRVFDGVVEQRRDGKVLVRVAMGGEEIRALCTVSASLRMGRVRLEPGDTVRLELFNGAHGMIGRVIRRIPVPGERGPARASERRRRDVAERAAQAADKPKE